MSDDEVALVDSSVWIEFLRGTGSSADQFLQRELGRDRIAITEPVLLEVLAGAPCRTASAVTDLLESQVLLGVVPGEDYLSAAQIYRAARGNGRTPRSLHDCLIAAVAVRHQVQLAHRDHDFEAIAAVTALATLDLR